MLNKHFVILSEAKNLLVFALKDSSVAMLFQNDKK